MTATDELAQLTAALADRYAIERELGVGGMAIVYLAKDLKHERKVALKVLRPELAVALGTERFMREIKITAGLTHPHILPLLDSGDADGFLFYVMPFVNGESLRDRMERERQLSLEDSLSITREIADALAAAHRCNVIHRDIKPENILLQDRHVFVADFGIARAITVAGGERLTDTGLAIGTPAYMSPEQACGEDDLDTRTDIYALGCILYELLAGEPPHVGPNAQAIIAKVIAAPVTRLSVTRETVPPYVETAVHKAIAKSPADRFRSMEAFLFAIDESPAAAAANSGRRGATANINRESKSHHLPVPATPLVGRKRETASILDLLLNSDTRLVTLTGTGGVGKSRLALHVGAECRQEFPDGVFFVGLATLRDAGLVIPSIARTIGLPETPGLEQMDVLLDVLRGKEMLLILDNLEHLVEAASDIGRLVTESASVRFLLTSRATLRIYGEREFPVPPLSLPDATSVVSSKKLASYEAIQLFISRANNARPGFTLTEANANAVAEVCRRLDGLPLALELAAARTKLLSPQMMLARLTDRLSLLTGGPRDAPARQQTLRDTIAWSYELLSSSDQTVFSRLSVFVGGCTLEAAESIITNATPTLDVDVLDTISTLVDNSLLQQRETTDGEIRFHMLETLREYGLEQLESNDGQAIFSQHAAFYLAFAEGAASELFGPRTAEWLARLEHEHDNLRAALRRFIDRGEIEQVLRLGAALGRFWRMHGHLGEGRERLESIIALKGDMAAFKATRAQVLLATGWLARDLGDYEAASRFTDEALAIGRELEDKGCIAWALTMLGVIARYKGHHKNARARLDDGIRVAKELGDKVCIAAALGNLGLVARDEGNYEEARELLDDSLATAREVGDSLGIAWPLTNLGLVAEYQGDHATAYTLHTEALELYRVLGDKQNIAYALNNLGVVATAQANYSDADAFFRESLQILAKVKDRRGIAFVFEGLACVALRMSRPSDALRLDGAAEAIRESIGSTAPPSWLQKCARHMEEARRLLNNQSAATARSNGRAMSLEQAIDSVLRGSESE